MPEGDTIWRTAARLNLALCGIPLTRLELRWGELGGAGLLPASTIGVVARGKHLLHRLDSGVTIHTHLRMEGSWRIHPTAKVTPAQLADHHLRVLVSTSTWTALGLRLGMVDVWPTEQDEARLAHLGPDVLGPDWDLDRALANLAGDESMSIGAALLDQTKLAGIGTFWASEGLFLNRLSPWTLVGEIPEQDQIGVVTGIRRLMRQATVSAVQSSTGRTRRGETSFVHARSGSPCRRCGIPIRVAMIGSADRQRTMFYCPNCQGGLAPGDDGARQSPLGAAERSRAIKRPRPKLRRALET
ncbi:DNA-formamidopyrimidine glycosylase family protein [Nostocoides vanveenii]|uniref:DNA-(apurinic or apyrimidinic site) lyase n=1 Tax=Nostocoides vanveenii TaxID=330835 RepID=A0ABN2K4N8_9MICO